MDANEYQFPEHQFPSIVGRPILRSEEQGDSEVVIKVQQPTPGGNQPQLEGYRLSMLLRD